jgi:hypothetical protein
MDLNGTGVAGGFLGKSTTTAEFVVEYLALFVMLVPLTGGALASVTTYQFRKLYLRPTFDTWKLKVRVWKGGLRMTPF